MRTHEVKELAAVRLPHDKPKSWKGWLLLSPLLPLFIFYLSDSIFLSGDTRHLRQLVSSTTRIEVERSVADWDTGQKKFTLQGEDAKSFIRGISLFHSIKYFLHKRRQTMGGEAYSCYFYANEKLILKMWIYPTGKEVILYNAGGPKLLYPGSAQYLNDFLLAQWRPKR